MASLVLTDSSQLTDKSFEKLPDQIMYPYAENTCLAAVTSDSQNLGIYLNVDCHKSAVSCQSAPKKPWGYCTLQHKADPKSPPVAVIHFIMSGEPTSKRIKDRESSYLSILEAIEICSREIADLKLDVRQKFSHIENRVGLVPSSYNRIMKRMEAIENVVKNVSLCENHQHNCCKEVLRRLDAIEGMLNGSDATVQTGRSKKTECTCVVID
uniref:Uncharacterized protein n=1 Tax=Timema cristinae TaxID=61476 RepID=A0A7R9CRB2_TIMCR|nr:unnamed protein product [Timema cristinae]